MFRGLNLNFSRRATLAHLFIYLFILYPLIRHSVLLQAPLSPGGGGATPWRSRPQGQQSKLNLQPSHSKATVLTAPAHCGVKLTVLAVYNVSEEVQRVEVFDILSHILQSVQRARQSDKKLTSQLFKCVLLTYWHVNFQMIFLSLSNWNEFKFGFCYFQCHKLSWSS